MELEQLQKLYLEQQDEINVLNEQIESFKLMKIELETKISELQTHNHALFLRVTSSTPTEEVEEEKSITIEDIIEKLK